MDNKEKQLSFDGCEDIEELERHEKRIKVIKKETLEYEREELIELLNAYYHTVRRTGQRCKSDGIKFAIEVIKDRYESGLLV